MPDSPAGGGFAGLFATPTLVSLLGLFLTQCDTDFYQRELAVLTGSRLVQVQRDLLRLERAGLVARRIVCDVAEGKELAAGERYGIIRFGSRLDVYLPEGAIPLVAVGQTAISGETVLADSISVEPHHI